MKKKVLIIIAVSVFMFLLLGNSHKLYASSHCYAQCMAQCTIHDTVPVCNGLCVNLPCGPAPYSGDGIHIGDAFASKYGRTAFFGDLVSSITSNAVVLAGILLLFILLGAGISTIIGAGKDDRETQARGHSAATGAVIGFMIIFGAYWIIQIIEALTGVDILNPTL